MSARLAAMAALALAAALVLAPRAASARTLRVVESLADVPETTAYITGFKPEQVVDKKTAPTVSEYHVPAAGSLSPSWWPQGTVFYRKAADSGSFTLNNALELTLEKVGFTVDGQWLDATASFDVRYQNGTSHNGTTSALAFFVLELDGSCDRAWRYASAGINPTTGSYTNAFGSVYITTRMSFFYHGGTTPYKGRIALYMNDLDVAYQATPREMVEIKTGFGDEVYVASNSNLDKRELAASENSRFVASWGPQNPDFSNGFVAYIVDSSATFEWGGMGCETLFGSIFSGYPTSRIQDPQKAIASVAGREVDPLKADAKRGDRVAFTFRQTLPYTVDANEPDSVDLVDVFDERFDISGAEVTVFQEKDASHAARDEVTEAWEKTVEGQTLTVSPKDAGDAAGTHTVTVSNVLVRKGARLGEVPNLVELHVDFANVSQGASVHRSNQVALTLVPSFERLEVEKVVDFGDGAVAAHGSPTFMFCLSGTRDGKEVELWRPVTFDTSTGASGVQRASCSFDLDGFDGTVTVREQGAARYLPVGASSPCPEATVRDGALVFDVTGGSESGVLTGVFENRLANRGGLSHTALAVNSLGSS